MKVGTMFDGNASRHPDKPAVILGHEQITFGALAETSSRVAHGLRQRGLKVGDRVVVYAGNTLELLQAIFGIWKAGGMVVPVTTWIVGRELAYMVGDCKPWAVVHGPEQAAAVAEATADLPGTVRIVIGGPAEGPNAVAFEALADGMPDTPIRLDAEPDLSMINYTSGTTGRPKGAVVTHANLVLGAMFTASLWTTTPDDVYMVSTPIAHRTGLSRLMSCCVLGATVVMMPRFEAKQAVELIERNGVTIFGCVPTVARIMLDYLDKTDHRCPTLRLLLATGEAFPIALKQRLKKRLPKVGLYSFYALTEAGVPAALGPEDQDSRPGSCGRPMPGMEIRLLDPEGRDVPKGESGEIAVRWGARGRGMVILEYFNRPDANAASFDGDWFKTGDVGRFDDDGFLYLVDRAKDMIISGGLNIYSREVEQAIEAMPGVAEVAVVGAPDAQFGEAVCAYVVRRDGADIDAGGVVEHCRRELASYKKPKHVFFMEKLPRNASGKVLKPELRKLAVAEVAAEPAGS